MRLQRLTDVRKVLIVFLIATTVFVVYLFVAKPRPRIFYKSMSYSEGKAFELYRENRRAGAPWTRDATEIALLLVHGCNHKANIGSDCFNPTRLEVYEHGAKRTTVIIVDDPIRDDDSIAAEEARLDFVKAPDGAWDLEWSGGRWRCQRSGSDWWTTSLCD